MHRIKPHDGIHPVQRPVFPALYLRKDTVRYVAYGLCRYAVAELPSRMSLISLVLLPMAYRPMILSASESARIFSRLRTTWGSKVPSRSRGVFMVISSIDVCTCLLICPLRRLPISSSTPSR